MEETVIVAAVQVAWKPFSGIKQFREEMYRYLRLAKTKNAGLVLLPELSGLLVTSSLLVEEQRHRKAQSGFLKRLRHAFDRERVTLAEALPQLVTAESDTIRSTYLDLFSTAAREHGFWIVGGSLYLRDEDGAVRALAAVFDANGSLHGWQAKFHLSDRERALAIPGDRLMVFEAPWGRFGVLLGSDILYPELGRALAYRGAIAIANPAAATTPAAWKRLRIAAMARAQENQFFVGQAFLVGASDLTAERTTFMGRSALWAPVELAPRADQPLIEVGAATVEGVISEKWDVKALQDLWQHADERPRESLRGPLFAKLLMNDYQSGVTIAQRASEIQDQAAHRAARAKPVLVPSPSWPEREARRDEEMVEVQPSANEFLARLEAEVESVLDLESAAEYLLAAQQSGESPQPAPGADQPNAAGLATEVIDGEAEPDGEEARVAAEEVEAVVASAEPAPPVDEQVVEMEPFHEAEPALDAEESLDLPLPETVSELDDEPAQHDDPVDQAVEDPVEDTTAEEAMISEAGTSDREEPASGVALEDEAASPPTNEAWEAAEAAGGAQQE